MAALLTLPLELLVAVSSHLSTPDLGALRLTCKQVEKSLYEWFSAEFFTKKQFMLTHDSLQTFIDISRHVGFSKKLAHVIIATNVYPAIPSSFKNTDAAARWIQGHNDQKELISTGFDYEMLIEAFSNLKNLQTVGIRDFDNNKRLRDGTSASWTSYGSTTVFRETGHRLYRSSDMTFFVPRVFKILIRALGKAGQCPQEIEVLMRHGCLADNAFHLPDFLHPTVKPMLQKLKKLLLTTDVGTNYNHTYKDENSADIQGGTPLRNFLGHTPNLTHLRLNLQQYSFDVNTSFLKWLSEPVSTSAAPGNAFLQPAPVSLDHLISLELGMFQAQPATILDVIAKFAPTLRELSLWRLTLLEPGSFPRPGLKPNKWVGLFANIAKLPQLQLSYLKTGNLKQDNMKVSFKVDGDDDAPLQAIREYSGPKMDEYLKTLLDETVVQWPLYIDKEGMEDDDDDDEMEDAEDEIEDAEDDEAVDNDENGEEDGSDDDED